MSEINLSFLNWFFQLILLSHRKRSSHSVTSAMPQPFCAPPTTTGGSLRPLLPGLCCVACILPGLCCVGCVLPICSPADFLVLPSLLSLLMQNESWVFCFRSANVAKVLLWATRPRPQSPSGLGVSNCLRRLSVWLCPPHQLSSLNLSAFQTF